MDKGNTAVQHIDKGEDTDAARAEVSVLVIQVGSPVEAVSSGSPATEAVHSSPIPEEETNEGHSSLEMNEDSTHEDIKTLSTKSSNKGDVHKKTIDEKKKKGSKVMGEQWESEVKADSTHEDIKTLSTKSSNKGDVHKKTIDEKKKKGSKVMGEQWESEVKALQGIVITSNVEDDGDDHIPEFVSAYTEETVSKNTEETVSKNTEETVSKNTEETVSKNTEETVSKNTEETISKNTEETVGMNTEETVGMNTEETVGMNTEETVGMNTEETVGMNTEETVGMDTEETVGMDTEEAVSEDIEETVSKNTKQTVSKNIEETVIKNTEETISEISEETVSKISEIHENSNVEVSTSELFLATADIQGCSYSPYSDKEADISEERVLMIDESEALHSENPANVIHSSCGILESDNVDEVSSKTVDTTDDTGTADEESTKEATSSDQKTLRVKSLSSIEESIERCIANYSCESSEEVCDTRREVHSPVIIPKKKRSAAKPVEVDKFPRNYGFKIITNKIDLCASPKGAFNIIPKLREDSPTPSGHPPVKRIKIQGKSLLDTTSQAVVSEEGSEQENGDKDSMPSMALANVKVAFRKSTEEPGVKITPKERPTIGLKVRDVESINAAIRTVRVPVSQILSDATNNSADSSVIDKGLPNKEFTSQACDKYPENGPEGTPIVCKSTLRPIAPKCEPIASNDQQAVKMIRDLIQLPSIPVYVPDVSDSKHFSGRLHLCHGCGDRFVLLKSLLEHQNRRSCVIKFQCLKCDSAILCFFNRCEFIRHLYNHNQTLTSTMLQYHITVERLPHQNSGIFDVKICQECKVFLKVPLADHMQCAETKEKKGPDLALKCQWCSLLLPTKCAYQAHRRMHFLQPPHVCPECGDLSSDLPSFNVHINSVCFHTSKRSLFQCSYCQTKVYDARKLERHISTKHIKDVFKCHYCCIACFSVENLETHIEITHEEKVAETHIEDDNGGPNNAYHLCDMCPNLLVRRVRLGQHVWDHIYASGDVTYVYECRKCKISFNSKEILSAHAPVCTVGPSTSNAPTFTTVLTNGSDILIRHPQTISSDMRLPIVEAQAPVTDSGSEVQSDFTESAVMPQQTPYQEDDIDMTVIDGADTLPPKTLAPNRIAQSVTPPLTSVVIQPSNNGPPKKKKKKATKKSPVKSESPKDDNNIFEGESSFVDDISLDTEEDSMQVVLNCMECGTNLTNELGSYCTLCEQKREAGDRFKTGTPNATLNVAKNKPPKKDTGGNFSCRICNALISRTCDKAAIKRHFISKHKEIFIAALQSGMISRKDESPVVKPNVPGDSTSKDGSPAKKSPVASFCKLSPKKKKKKAKKPVSDSDTEEEEEEDDDIIEAPSPPTREGKKQKEKRKKSYSPTFPALEQGMVATDEKDSETTENMRTCYKCSFKSVDKEEFMTHVATHKMNSKDLQCPACGMCFVVRPSLEKHLLILHGMQNVEEYLLEHGFPAVAKVPEELDVDMLDVNQCKVCHMKFDTEALLEKHFRTHGSAFLLSKQFRRSS